MLSALNLRAWTHRQMTYAVIRRGLAARARWCGRVLLAGQSRMRCILPAE